MIRPYQTNLLPIGFFDFLDADQAKVVGGEIVVFDLAPTDNQEFFAPDVYPGPKRSVVRLAKNTDTGPFFLVDSDRNTGVVSTYEVSVENTSLYSVASPSVVAMTSNVSGKLAIYAGEGFYAISVDVVDTNTVSINTPTNTPLYSDGYGHLTATPSQKAVIVGYLMEYRKKSVSSGFPQPFNYAGTNRITDTVVVYKSASDGYLNLSILDIAEQIGELGKLGVPTDGTFADGYVGLTPETKIADAVDLLNEGLLEVYGKTTFADPTLVSIQLIDFSSLVTVYADIVAGDDVNGDGSQGSPWATLQRAVAELRLGSLGTYVINLVGAGPYEAPILPSLNTSGLTVFIVGDTIAAPVGTFSFTGGGDSIVNPSDGYKAAAFSYNVGSYVATIGRGTHWLDTSSPGFPTGLVVDESVSPHLVVVAPNITGTRMLRSFITEITFRSGETTIQPINLGDQTLQNMAFVGCLFASSSLDASYCILSACRIEQLVYWSKLDPAVNFGGQTAVIVALAGAEVSGGSNLAQSIGGIIVGGLFLSDGSAIISGVIDGNIRIGLADYLFYKNLYNFTNLDLTNCSIDAIGANITFVRGISVDSTNRFLTADENSRIVVSADATIVGAVSGLPIILLNESTIKGVAGISLRNNVDVGEDITVGAHVTPVSFASLPLTDLSFGNTSQLCRAS